jgi:hypothetical protein
MTPLIISAMINAHETGLFHRALAALRNLARGAERPGGGASDRNWQRLMRTNDLWRYL